MPERQHFRGIRPIDPKVTKVIEAAKDQPITEEMLHEQRVSFAFGNSLGSDRITKDSVRKASSSIRISRD